jgi:hypothetical protein
LRKSFGQVEDLALLTESRFAMKSSHLCRPPAASVSALRDLRGKFRFRFLSAAPTGKYEKANFMQQSRQGEIPKGFPKFPIEYHRFSE